MCDAGMCEGQSNGEEMKEVGRALHDLCQPLTTLQCRLEIARMIGTAESYREAVELGLVECTRLMESVRSMQEIVNAAAREFEPEVMRAGR